MITADKHSTQYAVATADQQATADKLDAWTSTHPPFLVILDARIWLALRDSCAFSLDSRQTGRQMAADKFPTKGCNRRASCSRRGGLPFTATKARAIKSSFANCSRSARGWLPTTLAESLLKAPRRLSQSRTTARSVRPMPPSICSSNSTAGRHSDRQTGKSEAAHAVVADSRKQGLPAPWWPNATGNQLRRLATRVYLPALSEFDRITIIICGIKVPKGCWWVVIVAWIRFYAKHGSRDDLSGLLLDFSGALHSPTKPTLAAHISHRRLMMREGAHRTRRHFARQKPGIVCGTNWYAVVDLTWII